MKQDTNTLKEKTGRRFAREELFKLVFESQLLNINLEEVYADYKERSENFLKLKSQVEFMETYVSGISTKKDLIRDKISKEMDGWSLDRIGNVEKSLLYISVYELLNVELPPEIVVNEAIELAKEYGDTKSYEFINGILAKIIKTVR